MLRESPASWLMGISVSYTFRKNHQLCGNCPCFYDMALEISWTCYYLNTLSILIWKFFLTHKWLSAEEMPVSWFPNVCPRMVISRVYFLQKQTNPERHFPKISCSIDISRVYGVFQKKGYPGIEKNIRLLGKWITLLYLHRKTTFLHMMLEMITFFGDMSVSTL